MTFFYNLNDKLNAIREKPETTHKQLNERDMSRAAKGYEKYGKEGMQALAKAGREGKALDPVRAKYDKYDNKEVDEAALRVMTPTDVPNPDNSGRIRYISKTAADKKGVPHTDQMQAHRDSAAKQIKSLRAQGKDPSDQPDMRVFRSDFEEGQLNELSPELLKRARDKAGMKYAQADDRRDQKASDKYNAQDDKFNSALRKKQKDMDEGMGDVAKRVGSAVKKAGGAVLNRLGHGSDEDMRRDLQRKMGMTPTGDKPDGALKYAAKTFVKHAKDPLGLKNEAGLPMTTVNGKKVPKFAADGQGANDLAKKKSFANKIAGAKKEVDEMLGDVAAEAMKSALSGGQKKLDKNNNGRLDANDFAMLRKGGKQSTAEASGAIDFDKVLDAIAALYGDDIWDNDAMQDLANDLEQAGPTDRELDFIIAKGKLPKRLASIKFSAGDNVQFGEGFDDMERDVKNRMSARKVGDVTHGAKHDTQEIPGGRRVTRRVDPNTGYSVGADDDKSADSEKRGRGRPKGTKGAIGAKGPSGRSKLMTREDHMDPNEYDSEGDMAKEQLHTMKLAAKELSSILGDDENLPEWVQSKITKALDYIDTARDYMISTKADREMEPVAEKAVSKNQAVAARIARGVQKGEVKAEPGTASAEMAKMEPKELKKFAKTDTKKLPKKKEKTEEQGGTGTPTASSGFSYGKGIYDSIDLEVENMIAEGMNINMSMNSDAQGGPSRSLTVTATDDDAMKLASLLKMAGLGNDSHHGGYGHTMDEAYGDNEVSENEPDYPTNTTQAENNFEYAGGLNKPKSTGQSTVPVLASQEERQESYAEVEEDAIKRMMEMAGVKKKEVDEEKTEEGNLFTKGLADDDIKVGEKIPGTNAVKKKDIDEGILASTANLWKEYKTQHGV